MNHPRPASGAEGGASRVVPPWSPPERSVVAVGLFDGVHKGHRRLLRDLAVWAREADAAPVVLTFDPQPAVLVTGSAPPLVVGARHRVELIRSLGIEHVWLLAMTRELARLCAEDFLRTHVVDPLGGVGLLVGFDNHLGSDRADYGTVSAMAEALGLSVRTCEPVIVNGAPVSSTMVRQAIVAGDLVGAEYLLGRRVAIFGRVVTGAGRGRGLGYPTANLRLEHEAMVPCGIYAGEVRLEGMTYLAAISIGSCPTFGGREAQPGSGPYVEERHTVEVHILDFDGDLVGRDLEVAITGKLREEQRFASTEELVAQMDADIRVVRDRG